MKIFVILILINNIAFANTVYEVDLNKSALNWSATKVGGGHSGVINPKVGTITLIKNDISKGHLTVDMNSITCLDIKDQELNNKFINEIKSDVFFNVKKYPEASLKIKKLIFSKGGSYEAIGDLKIRGVNNSVTLDLNIERNKDTIKIKSKFEFDRTKFNIYTESTSLMSFFGNKIVDDNVKVEV
ncbi:MAG: YceI family protein, partial [Bdellovibrionales bacterium]|nr:YceI family protein [Bdellovibrionales bacterium]